MAIRIPLTLLKEFMVNERLTGVRPNGTRPIDLKVFQQVIQETLQNEKILQKLVNTAGKQGVIQAR
jgi:hypothetical protein